MTDRIEKRIVLRAPAHRVWRALTESAEFGAWFGMKLDGPFTAGTPVRGVIMPTNADAEVAKAQEAYRGLPVEIMVEQVQPEHLFSFRWHPNAVERDVNYSGEPTTLIVFTLQDVAGGTQLTVVESGFDQIPLARRAKAFTANDGGWTMVMKLVEQHFSHMRHSAVRRAHARSSAPLFAALGDDARLRLVSRLCDHGPLSIAKLTAGADITRQAITKHLHVLEHAGLVRESRRGRESVWQLEARRLSRARRYLDQISAQWDQALGRLRELVEDPPVR